MAELAFLDQSLTQVFAGLLVGAMLPYWFSAMTMKSVGKAALAMVEEVRRQFNEIPGLMEGTARPDYRRCVEISTSVSLTLLLFLVHISLCLLYVPMFIADVFSDNAKLKKFLMCKSELASQVWQ